MKIAIACEVNNDDDDFDEKDDEDDDLKGQMDRIEADNVRALIFRMGHRF